MLPLGAVDRFTDVLLAVNAALELDWDPATFGTLATEVPRMPRTMVEDALITALAAG